MQITDEMIEKAARALCKADGTNPDLPVQAHGHVVSIVGWHFFKDQAKAALEAALK